MGAGVAANRPRTHDRDLLAHATSLRFADERSAPGAPVTTAGPSNGRCAGDRLPLPKTEDELW